MLKPERLKKGSKIAIISPSGGAAASYQHVFKLGIKKLSEVLDVETVIYSSVQLSDRELYLSPEKRAEDLNKAFADPDIDGIITTIGGYDSIRILKYLDTDVILKNPKWIMGFSDATTFLAYLNSIGMVTFYGPSVMAGLAQMEHLPVAFKKHLRTFLMEPFEAYHYTPFESWTNGYMDWNVIEDAGKCKVMHSNGEGWSFISGTQKASGKLWGGCIEVLEFIKGTQFWPREEFWENRIIMLETSEEKPTPMQVGYMLRNYGMQGILHQINGLLIGRPKDYSQSEKNQLKQIILDMLKIEFQLEHLTVAFNVDFGHTDPKMILPMGCKITLDPMNNTITLNESPFAKNDKRDEKK